MNQTGHYSGVLDLSEEYAFEEAVARSPLPVLADFWAPWCSPCRAQGPILEHLAGEMSDRLRIVKINVDRFPELAELFGVRAIPTLILFRDGIETARLTGLQSTEDLKRAVGS